jgi:hypothetical protein
MAQGHISLSISPFLVIYANTSKTTNRSATSLATTWFVFAKEIQFPISKSNTLVEA